MQIRSFLRRWFRRHSDQVTEIPLVDHHCVICGHEQPWPQPEPEAEPADCPACGVALFVAD
jgi:hypothetical protein